MTKRNLILQAAVAAALVSAFGGAYAGAITSPVNDAAATKYAAEALTSSTAVTTPDVVYTMGVARTTAQDFTMIFTPSAGATLTPANCLGANFTVAGGGAAATISTKRASATECAVEVDVTTAFTTATTITSSAGGTSALVLATHPLATAGSSVSYTVALKDLGETAYIDNTGTLTRVVATSLNAVNVYAAASDTDTTADVNAVAGPLKGFEAGGAAPADTAAVAAAYLTIDNNSVGAKIADGATAFDFKTTTGTLTISLTDANKAFSGLKANKLCVDLNSVGASACGAGEIFTVTGSTGTITTPAANAGATVTQIPATGATNTVWATFENDTTTALGTSRTIAVTGTVNPAVGAAHAFADTASKNATAWVWDANAIELWSPYFSTASGWISRFVFQNTGTASVGYSATCLAETGNTVIPGAAVTGTLVPGMTVVNAADVCTFSGNTRGNVRFIINAPAGNIHGTYNLVNAATGSSTVAELTRPFGTTAGTTW